MRIKGVIAVLKWEKVDQMRGGQGRLIEAGGKMRLG